MLAGQAVREGVDGLAHQGAEIDLLELVAALLLDARELQHALHQRRSAAAASARMVSRYSASFSGERMRSICSVSVAALSSDNGVFSWCDTCATKSVCIRASSADRRCACTVSPSATSISSIDSTVGQ